MLEGSFFKYNFYSKMVKFFVFFSANYIFKLLNNSLNFATVVTEDRNPKFLKYIVAPVLYYKVRLLKLTKEK